MIEEPIWEGKRRLGREGYFSATKSCPCSQIVGEVQGVAIVGRFLLFGYWVGWVGVSGGFGLGGALVNISKPLPQRERGVNWESAKQIVGSSTLNKGP